LLTNLQEAMSSSSMRSIDYAQLERNSIRLWKILVDLLIGQGPGARSIKLDLPEIHSVGQLRGPSNHCSFARRFGLAFIWTFIHARTWKHLQTLGGDLAVK